MREYIVLPLLNTLCISTGQPLVIVRQQYNYVTYVCCCIECFAVKSGAALLGLYSEMLTCCADQSVGAGVRS